MINRFYLPGVMKMKHIKTLNKANLRESAEKGGCGKCQASCQSACKTSCTVANQKCERQRLVPQMCPKA
jgi:predicted ribosomally synthesized six-cysteine peptide SCIFF